MQGLTPEDLTQLKSKQPEDKRKKRSLKSILRALILIFVDG